MPDRPMAVIKNYSYKKYFTLSRLYHPPLQNFVKQNYIRAKTKKHVVFQAPESGYDAFGLVWMTGADIILLLGRHECYMKIFTQF